jgi:hypothetical protein
VNGTEIRRRPDRSARNDPVSASDANSVRASAQALNRARLV